MRVHAACYVNAHLLTAYMHDPSYSVFIPAPLRSVATVASLHLPRLPGSGCHRHTHESRATSAATSAASAATSAASAATCAVAGVTCYLALPQLACRRYLDTTWILPGYYLDTPFHQMKDQQPAGYHNIDMLIF